MSSRASANRVSTADKGALREALDAALGTLSEDDLMYDHPQSMVGPMDPVLFVRYDRLRAALSSPSSFGGRLSKDERPAFQERGPEPLDVELLGMAMDMVSEEDAQVGVVGRGSYAERVATRYAALSKETTA